MGSGRKGSAIVRSKSLLAAYYITSMQKSVVARMLYPSEKTWTGHDGSRGSEEEQSGGIYTDRPPPNGRSRTQLNRRSHYGVMITQYCSHIIDAHKL